MRVCNRALAMLAAVLALSSLLLTPARADAIVPHSDPIVAANQMRHGGPLPPAISTISTVTAVEQWRRYHEEEAAATERAIHDRFHYAGPWEAIAAQKFGVYAKPEATGWTAMPVPLEQHPARPPDAPPAPTPPPISVPPTVPPPAPTAPIEPKAVASPVPTATPAVDATHPREKPTLPHDTIMRLIKRYTDIIAQYRVKHAAEAEKAQRIATAAAAWAAANPPKRHDTAEPPSVPAPHHHRFGVPTHKRPPLPAHVTPMPLKARRVEFVLKFSGVCVDNATATALGKHANPHNHQPPQHYLKHHRRGAHAKSEPPSQEVPYCSLKAQSQEITTHVHPNSGVDMTVTKMVGSVARLDLFDLSVLSETEFVTRGNCSFGSARRKSHTLAFESAGSARVFKFKTGERAFTGQFQVTDGGGGFDGHRGVLTLSGVWSSPTRVTALVTGLLYPPEDLKTRRVSALKQSPFYRRSSRSTTQKQPPADDDDDDDDDDEDEEEKKQSPIRLRV